MSKVYNWSLACRIELCKAYLCSPCEESDLLSWTRGEGKDALSVSSLVSIGSQEIIEPYMYARIYENMHSNAHAVSITLVTQYAHNITCTHAG